MLAAAAILSGLYDGASLLTHRSLMTQLLLSGCIGALVLIAGDFYLSGWSAPADWVWEVEKAVLTWLVCILFTRAVFATLADVNAFKRRILVLGTGEMAKRIAALSENRSNPNFVTVAYLDSNWTVPKRGENSEINSADDHLSNAIVRRARELKAHEIVIAMGDRRGLPVRELLECRKEGIKVINYLDFIERETNSIDILALQPGWLLFSDGFRFSRWNDLSKRCTDIIFSVVLLLFTFPLMLMTSLLIVLNGRGPVLYRQDRVGQGGRHFVLLKFRSMRIDAEKDGLAKWATNGDARVTRIGRVIRKLRIDELPQLLNVLRGDMSFVGPRPERPFFVESLARDIPYYRERLRMRPGITGWAQINYPYGASIEDAKAKLSYDLYYIKNYSIFFDLIIAIGTVQVVLWNKGAR
jgi:sugar transferase (PEP-CTERM system associated)